MKRVASFQLVPGMVVAEDVYNYNNQLILPKGTVLTDEIITRLDFYSVIHVYISEEKVSDSEKERLTYAQPPEPSFSQRLQQTPQFQEFKQKYDYQVEGLKNTLNDVVGKNTEVDPNALLSEMQTLLTNSPGPGSLFDMLHNMHQYNDATFMHCINVALICNTFAKWLSFSQEDTDTVTLCGLLHDIGKLMVPLDILNKPSKLTETEFSVIKQHPMNGYLVLKDLPLDPIIAQAALCHHEKCDGSGYPRGIKGDRLDRFTKMVTIADIYEAMTCARIYRGPLCPFRVIGLFEKDGYQKYDTQYLLTFLSHVADTYLSYRVHLSNGMEGEVIYINKQKLDRPLVRCGSEYIDLNVRRDLEIEYII